MKNSGHAKGASDADKLLKEAKKIRNKAKLDDRFKKKVGQRDIGIFFKNTNQKDQQPSHDLESKS